MADTMEQMRKDIEDMLRGQLDDPKDDKAFQELLDDVTTEGCVSGIVSGMIYYTDTEKFYDLHKVAINDLLAQSLADMGAKSPAELFGEDKWDAADPLAMDTTNKNLLAWFAVEEIARTLQTIDE